MPRCALPIWLLAVLLAAALSGCGPKSNLVPLEYIPLGQEDALCARPLAVGTFIDKRPAEDIGRDHNFVYYPKDTTVTDWVADAFRQELAARGCTVESGSGATPFGEKLLLTGDVRRVSLVRDGWDYTMHIELTVRLHRDGEPAFHKTFSGVWERTHLTPSDTRYRDMLRQGLQELLGDILAQLRPALSRA